MPVARDDLRRAAIGLEAEALARDPLDLRLERRVGSHGSGQLADAVRLERGSDPRPRAIELEGPPGELPAEGRRLGVDAVRAADAERRPVLLAPTRDRVDRAVDPLEHERAGTADLERQTGVDDIRRRQPVVYEPALCTEILCVRVTIRRPVGV